MPGLIWRESVRGEIWKGFSGSEPIAMITLEDGGYFWSLYVERRGGYDKTLEKAKARTEARWAKWLKRAALTIAVFASTGA